MDGEISIVPAKKGSREALQNRLGVEFKVRLSDQEIFEALYMRKVNNGTVVLEVLRFYLANKTHGGSYEGASTCLEAHIIITVPPNITFRSITIHSLIFPINIHPDVNMRVQRMDLFTNRGLVESKSKQLKVNNTLFIGVGSGAISGYVAAITTLTKTLPTRQ
jgi:hypothetical protein